MTTTETAPKSKAKSRKAPTKPKTAKAKGKPGRRSNSPAASTNTEPKAPRLSKQAIVVEALCRPEGATLQEMMELTRIMHGQRPEGWRV